MYCLKCRAKREGRDHKNGYLKGGSRRTIEAHCEVCGTKMIQLLGNLTKASR